jgi:hypothetical protein
MRFRSAKACRTGAIADPIIPLGMTMSMKLIRGYRSITGIKITLFFHRLMRRSCPLRRRCGLVLGESDDGAPRATGSL